MKLQHFTMITESLQITDIKQNIVNIGQKQEILKGMYGEFRLSPPMPEDPTDENLEEWQKCWLELHKSFDKLVNQLIEHNIKFSELSWSLRLYLADYCRIYHDMEKYKLILYG